MPGALLLVLLGGMISEGQAAKLTDVSVLDKDYLVVHVSDGKVIHDEGVGETVIRHTPELDTGAAVRTDSWTIESSGDASYGESGRHPQGCHRKTKLNGHAQMEWSGRDYRYESTYEHWIYLRLPTSLQQGATYTLKIDATTNIDSDSASFTYDVFHSRSEAVHVNLVGYLPDATHKAADLYHWMGDGGARDYSTFEGNTVYVYNVDASQAHPVGLVSFWMPSGSDVGKYNLTRSDVWNVDFSAFTDTGTYRLVVEGVGCSQDFEIANGAYADPFKVAVRGYYYMRIGEEETPGIKPPPRTPPYIPGVNPGSTTVYLTTMQPWHSEWKTFSRGDVWDRPDDWAAYRKPGNPTNPNAWGGHSDAADSDRHLGHVSSIYDMLLPFLMTNGAIGDDDTGIAESGNGIPDLLDEARYEVDFWLRLRDGDGYSHGLTNPHRSNQLFQAGPTAIAAWANAAGTAMLADAFRVAGRTSLMDEYKDAAVTAYDHASGLADPMLDQGEDLDGLVRGRDFKMMAAAFLYNVTGDRAYEEVVNTESVCASGPAALNNAERNQVWATAAYLITPQPVHYPTLQSNMRAAIVSEARTREAGLIDRRPSRRATDEYPAYFRTAQNVQRTIIAHAVTDDPSDRDFFRKALALEADWSLGRNPLNMIQMTTAWTPLASKRSVPEAHTSGMEDGVAGVDPGHTPYMNLDDWSRGMLMGMPSRLYEDSYPPDVKSAWPAGEAYFPSRWVWAHTEFTPQQTMRGKLALYAYLHGLGRAPAPTAPTLTVSTSGAGSGTVTSSPPGIECGSDCSEAYGSGTKVTLTAAASGGSKFTGWTGACSGAGPCAPAMSSNRSVAATFEPIGLAYPLSVTLPGTGSGTVTSSPAGISCGTECTKAYPSGSRVTLSASASSDSTFAGWSGVCSGTGACTVGMRAARSVTANFRSNTPATATIYGDALADGWSNWSWGATIDFSGTSPVRVGTHAANVTLAAWGGFSPRKRTAVDTYGYAALKFWVHGGTGSDKVLTVFTQTTDEGGVSPVVEVTATANTWTEITVSLDSLGNPASIKRLNLSNNTPRALPMVTLDDIRLEPASSSDPPSGDRPR